MPRQVFIQVAKGLLLLSLLLFLSGTWFALSARWLSKWRSS